MAELDLESLIASLAGPAPVAAPVEPEQTQGAQTAEGLISLLPVLAGAFQGGSALQNVAGVTGKRFLDEADKEEAIKLKAEADAKALIREQAKFKQGLVKELGVLGTKEKFGKAKEGRKEVVDLKLIDAREKAKKKHGTSASTNIHVDLPGGSKKEVEELSETDATIQLLDKAIAKVEELPDQFFEPEGLPGRLEFNLKRAFTAFDEGKISLDLDLLAKKMASALEHGRISDFDFITYKKILSGDKLTTSRGDAIEIMRNLQDTLDLYTLAKREAVAALSTDPNAFLSKVNVRMIERKLPVMDPRVFGRDRVFDEIKNLKEGREFLLRSSGTYQKAVRTKDGYETLNGSQEKEQDGK